MNHYINWLITITGLFYLVILVVVRKQFKDFMEIKLFKFEIFLFFLLIIIFQFSGWFCPRAGDRWTDRRRPIAEPLLRLRPLLFGLRLQTVAIVRQQRHQEPRKASLKTTTENILAFVVPKIGKNKDFGEKQNLSIFSFSLKFSQLAAEFNDEICHSFQSTIFRNLKPSQLTISYHLMKLW